MSFPDCAERLRLSSETSTEQGPLAPTNERWVESNRHSGLSRVTFHVRQSGPRYLPTGGTDATPVVRSGGCESSTRPRSWTRRERSREAAGTPPSRSSASSADADSSWARASRSPRSATAAMDDLRRRHFGCFARGRLVELRPAHLASSDPLALSGAAQHLRHHEGGGPEGVVVVARLGLERRIELSSMSAQSSGHSSCG